MGWTKVEEPRLYWFKIPPNADSIYFMSGHRSVQHEDIAVAPGWLYEKGNTQYMIPYRGPDSNREHWLGIRKENEEEWVHCLNPNCKRYVVPDEDNPFSSDYEETGLPAFYIFEKTKEKSRLMYTDEIISFCDDFVAVLDEFPEEYGSNAKSIITNHLTEQAKIMKNYKSHSQPSTIIR